MSRKKTKESKSPQQRRREEERDLRREAILHAALHLFARQGYTETTLTGIANQARLGKATLYYYFPDKETIFWTIYTEETTAYYRRIAEQILDIRDPVEIVRNYVLEYIEYGFRNPDFLRLIFPVGKSSLLGTEAHRQYQQQVDQVRQPLDIHLHEVLEQNRSPLTGDELTSLLWTIMSGLSLKIVQGSSQETVRNEAERLLSLVTSQLEGDGA